MTRREPKPGSFQPHISIAINKNYLYGCFHAPVTYFESNHSQIQNLSGSDYANDEETTTPYVSAPISTTARTKTIYYTHIFHASTFGYFESNLTQIRNLRRLSDIRET